MRFSADAIDDMPREVIVGDPLWPFKHNLDQLRVLEEGDPYTYSSQMQQNPSPLGGGMFKDRYWKYYDVLPPDIYIMRIYADTAQKTKERNDFSVFQCWAKSASKGIFLIDQCRFSSTERVSLNLFTDAVRPTAASDFSSMPFNGMAKETTISGSICLASSISRTEAPGLFRYAGSPSTVSSGLPNSSIPPCWISRGSMPN